MCFRACWQRKKVKEKQLEKEIMLTPVLVTQCRQSIDVK